MQLRKKLTACIELFRRRVRRTQLRSDQICAEVFPAMTFRVFLSERCLARTIWTADYQ